MKSLADRPCEGGGVCSKPNGASWRATWRRLEREKKRRSRRLLSYARKRFGDEADASELTWYRLERTSPSVRVVEFVT